MTKPNILHINGKNYDTRNGQIITDIVPFDRLSPPVKIDKTPKSNRLNDQPPANLNPAKIHKPPFKDGQAISEMLVPGLPKPRSPAQSIISHQPERGQTLMRRGVAKPTPQTSSVRRINTPAGSLPSRRLPTLPANKNISDKLRLERAKKITQNSQVKHFDLNTYSINYPKTTSQISLRPAAKPALKTNSSKVTQMASASKLENLLASGLARADSHLESPPKIAKRGRRRSRKLAATIAGLAVLLIVGIYGYRNLPDLNVHIAASRSGVNAELPGYTPSGFALAGVIKYNPGTVQVNYYFGNQHFSLVQKNSNWDSASLKQNFVSGVNSAVQTARADGLTVYLFANGNATWVNNNVWYQISGNALLSHKQLLNIATSL